MRRRRRMAGASQPVYIFNSFFEERKTCEYLRNLLRSMFTDLRTNGVFEIAHRLAGTDTVLSILKEKYADRIGEDELNEWNHDYDTSGKDLPVGVLRQLLREDMLDIVAGRLEELGRLKASETEKRLASLKRTFGLSKTETEILCFRYLIDNCEPLKDHLFSSQGIADFTRSVTFKNYGHIVLGIRRSDFLRALARDTLFASNIFEKNYLVSYDLAGWCTEYLSSLREGDLAGEFFSRDNDIALEPGDFELPEDELAVVHKFMKSARGHNILLYGEPGAGKTSFAKSLARFHGKELLTVRVSENDNLNFRQQAIYVTLNFADRNSSVILVDEADELLNTSRSFFFESKTNKSWINNLLDSHSHKIVWVTNRSGEIDPSTMRRFSFALEFKRFNADSRLKALGTELKKRGLEGYFTGGELADLCGSYNVNADGIIKAIETLEVRRGTAKESVMSEIRTVLCNHEKATSGQSRHEGRPKGLESYTLEGLNTSFRLEDMVSVVRKQAGLPAGEGKRPVTLLLHGAPGTGKTQFVHYLGKTLKKEVVLRRCSDIQSKWVGETEKNIAGAFMEARGGSGILFFDEADSFFYPRKNADHSWEITATNEILSQLDTFNGIAIFATNEIDGLDHAALRRFRFKIEFRPLTPEGNLHFYDTLITPVIPNCTTLNDDERNLISRISNLTPGDFSVVRDQLLFIEPTHLSHGMAIELLIKESGHKKESKQRIGF